jgi:hypothetical protein
VVWKSWARGKWLEISLETPGCVFGMLSINEPPNASAAKGLRPAVTFDSRVPIESFTTALELTHLVRHLVRALFLNIHHARLYTRGRICSSTLPLVGPSGGLVGGQQPLSVVLNYFFMPRASTTSTTNRRQHAWSRHLQY